MKRSVVEARGEVCGSRQSALRYAALAVPAPVAAAARYARHATGECMKTEMRQTGRQRKPCRPRAQCAQRVVYTPVYRPRHLRHAFAARAACRRER